MIVLFYLWSSCGQVVLRPLFEFDDYVRYLTARLDAEGQRSGLRLAAAKAAACHPAYLSRVTQGKAQLSLEQAERLNAFFEHTPDEGHFFLLLIQRARAGTPGLRRYFDAQLASERQKRLDVKRRVASRKTVSVEHEARYYGYWLNAAVHVLLSVPALQTPEALSRHLGISREKILETLAFLTEAGLAVPRRGRFAIGPSDVHLGAESPHIARHHANWRTQTLVALDRGGPDGLHYSAVVAMAAADALVVKESLLGNLEKNLGVIRASPEEAGWVLAFDFFRLGR